MEIFLVRLCWIRLIDPRSLIDIIPIPGTKRRERLEENLRALEIKLSKEDLRRIDEAAPVGFAAGTRYPEVAMHTVNR
jgi:aryl-alcohol dehydrogenase-like predicted oxidoreductase